jgi:pimeloyl-ACP methyl ester carboxylesterase
MHPLDKPGDPAAQLKTLVERCAQCAERLRAEGHDLAAYNTNESADDIEDLRIALGAEKITLWGTSYGTHLALAYLRRHGEHVERLILAGVEGPDHTLKLPSDQQRQLERLAALVKTDPVISRAIPDFLQLVRDVLDRLDRNPQVVHLEKPGNPPRLVTIGKWDLQRLTAEAMGRTQTAKSLPLLYYEMSQGDFSRVARAVVQMRTDSLPSAMSFVMDCASGASPERLKRIEREAPDGLVGNAVNFPFPEIGAAWNAPDLGEEFRGPLRSDVPVLLISGTLDGRTPPTNAEEILTGLPNGLHLVVEGAGHHDDLFVGPDELRRRMVAFAAGQSISTEPIRLPPLKFDWRERP